MLRRQCSPRHWVSGFFTASEPVAREHKENLIYLKQWDRGFYMCNLPLYVTFCVSAGFVDSGVDEAQVIELKTEYYGMFLAS